MSGITDGYVGIGYGGLDRIDAVVDGGANTGSVAKFAAGGPVGTDTLIDVENPLFSGFTIGGLSIRGTVNGDTFDVTPQGEQWMSIRAGAGTDSYTINGTGRVRLDFRDATEALDINLGNTPVRSSMTASAIPKPLAGQARSGTFRGRGLTMCSSGRQATNPTRHSAATTRSTAAAASTGAL